ncbi:hypothetical protein HYDPIDRAFT_170952 [Hydnomerulius pinastri MD-312]|uniref:Uncharacterized protein n=1 Tax=Hydnomerulius pinastri MD-312 TaxID=994086 RepID=A0A0C9W036_9AGAM|nr:hypothetical protein HYDPIDRAFT_170952 [Hydnomerulius pinastri MD-312]
MSQLPSPHLTLLPNLLPSLLLSPLPSLLEHGKESRKSHILEPLPLPLHIQSKEQKQKSQQSHGSSKFSDHRQQQSSPATPYNPAHLLPPSQPGSLDVGAERQFALPYKDEEE